MRFYLQTKFRGSLRGLSVFCVDLAWNDPTVTSYKNIENVMLYRNGSKSPKSI